MGPRIHGRALEWAKTTDIVALLGKTLNRYTIVPAPLRVEPNTLKYHFANTPAWKSFVKDP